MKRAGWGFFFSTFALIVFIVFCMAETVHGQEDIQRAEQERWYREREAVLLADTREYLSDAGFLNSGVTLSRTVDAEGNRSYTFTIHHRKIDCMDESERQALGEKLLALTENFADMSREDDCTFLYRFLIP